MSPKSMQYKANSIIFFKGDLSDRVFLLNSGKVTLNAIDIETGAFELADNVLMASKRLLARCPDAQIWCVRIGYNAVHRFGASSSDSEVLPTLDLGVTMPGVDLNDSAALVDLMGEKTDLYGSCSGQGLERPDQLELEERDPIE